MKPRNYRFTANILFVLLLGAGNLAVAGAPPAGMAPQINTTVTHLEAALKAVNADDLSAAQEHVKAAGQSSKLIMGGSFEARKQRGSRAITSARQLLDQGNSAGAADSIKEALEGFKSLLRPAETGNQGGL